MRQERTWVAVAGMGMAGWWLGGCAAERRLPDDAVRVEPVGRGYALVDYLPGRYPVEREYRLDGLPGSSAKSTAYRRIDGPDRRVEGNALGRKFDRLERYYPRLAGEESTRQRPKAPFDPWGGGILEFDPALQEFPARLAVGQRVEYRCRVKQYWADGSPGLNGQVFRAVTLEGLESVKTQAGEFVDCLRIRVDMELKLWVTVHVISREHLWLAPGVGEVRRLFSVWGRALLWLVNQRIGYELAKAPAFSETALSLQPGSRRRWARAAVLIRWKGWGPQLSGLVIEYQAGPWAKRTGPEGRNPGDLE